MKLTPRIERSILRVCSLHGNQKRKVDGAPYFTHPCAVVFILLNYTEDEDIIDAGAWHDILEDVKGYSEKEMRKECGERTIRIVMEVTEEKYPQEDKKATWKKRKNAYLKHLEEASYEAMMVCAADKIHNLISIQREYKQYGEVMWEKFNAPKELRMWYYESVLAILKRRLKNDIVRELEMVFLETKKTITKAQ